MVDKYAFTREDAKALLMLLKESRVRKRTTFGKHSREAAGHLQYLVEFKLEAALTTSDASKAATITDGIGPGKPGPTGASGITVTNTRTSAGAGAYIFAGDSGDYGLAYWDSGTTYRIVQLECP